MIENSKHKLQLPRIAIYIILAAVTLLSCTRRPLELPSNKVYIRIDSDYTMPYRELPIKPYHYTVLAYDAGVLSKEADTFCQEAGGAMDLSPGERAVFVYNLGVGNITIDGRDSLHTLRAVSVPAPPQASEAFSICQQAFVLQTKAEGKDANSKSGWPGFEGDNVIEEPEPLFGGWNRAVSVPHLTWNGPDFTFPVETSFLICQSEVILKGIQGAENISKVQMFVTNLASSRSLVDGEPDDRPAIIGFEAKVGEDGTVRGVFNHFGKLGDGGVEVPEIPVETVNTAYVVLTARGGGSYLFVQDITDQVQSHSEDATYELEVDYEIPTDPHTGGGGFTPSTEDWEAILNTVILGF